MRPERTTTTRSHTAVRGRKGKGDEPHPGFPGSFFLLVDERGDPFGLLGVFAFRLVLLVVFPVFWVFLAGGIGSTDVVESEKNCFIAFFNAQGTLSFDEYERVP